MITMIDVQLSDHKQIDQFPTVRITYHQFTTDREQIVVL